MKILYYLISFIPFYISKKKIFFYPLVDCRGHVQLSLHLSLSIFKEQDTGFPLTERDRLGIRGLLPPRVISFEPQYARFSKFMLDLKISLFV